MIVDHGDLLDGATAVFSDDRKYRYRLDRHLGGAGPVVLFVMLNPSTADATKDDPTVKRCIGYAQRFGGSRLIVCNAYAIRGRDPAVIVRTIARGRNPVSEEPRDCFPDSANDQAIIDAARESSLRVVAWGTMCEAYRAAQVYELLHSTTRIAEADAPAYALHVTAAGAPGHPLYLPGDAELVEWSP